MGKKNKGKPVSYKPNSGLIMQSKQQASTAAAGTKRSHASAFPTSSGKTASVSKEAGTSGAAGSLAEKLLLSKRLKKAEDKRVASEDSEEIDKRCKISITDEMFEAAKLMRNGVSHVKDLDMKVLTKTSA